MKFYKRIENKNRQSAALKLIMPLLLMVFFSVYLLQYINIDLNLFNILVILCLIFLYFYYFIFVIYGIIKKNVIDEKTGCLLQSEFLKYLNNNDNVVFFTILNMNEIKLRLGFENSDKILMKLIDKFYKWDENLIISRITTADFMILSPINYRNLQHEVKKIFNDVKKNRIDGVDLKIDFSIVKSDKNFTKLYLEAQNKLQDKIDVETENIISNSIELSIKKSDYSMKIQRLEGDEEIYYLNYKINTDYPEKVSQNKLEKIIIKQNLEYYYYVNLLNCLVKEYNFYNRIIIKISADFLRNLKFLIFLQEYFLQNLKAKNKIIFEFFENEIYYDLSSFEEIIKEYQKLGITFALNRVGSPSSIEYLKRFDFEFAIFDIEFNRRINNKRYYIIYENLYKLCKELNIKTIIRFVDNQAFLDLTKDIKFDYYQGFLFYKDKNLKEMK